MDKSIYRQAAMERLASPEDLEGRLVITTPRNWVFIVANVALVFVVILWGIMGHIPIKVEGQGILMPTGGFYQVTHEESGTVMAYHVRSGDYVKEGQLIAQLKTKSQTSSEDVVTNIVASKEGRVLETYKKTFEYYEALTPFVLIACETPDKSDLEMKMYVSAMEGKLVKPGMNVHISPTTVKAEQYGFLKGRVTKISEYPVSEQALFDTLENESIINQVLAKGPVLEVEVALMKNENTISGYAWSTPKGPDEGLDSGTFSYGAVVVDEVSPISYVIPMAN